MDSVRVEAAMIYNDDALPKETRSEMLSRHTYASKPPRSRGLLSIKLVECPVAADFLNF